MSIGLIGEKVGMTRLFLETGDSIPVSVIKISPNHITQIRTDDVDGYTALQVGMNEMKPQRVSKPMAGHFKKAGVSPRHKLCEFRVEDVSTFNVGDQLTVEQFKEGDKVDVTGITKGRGFSGGVRRWNFRTQDATHGNSVSHRVLGSIGQNQDPGRVFPGKKMAGHYGNERCTVQSLKVMRVDAERGLLLVKGSIPGAPGKYVIVKPAAKAVGE
jgi:large subunit ribosomal protein L3